MTGEKHGAWGIPAPEEEAVQSCGQCKFLFIFLVSV